MAITPPYCVDEEELMSLKSLLEEDDYDAAADRDIEEMMRSCLSMAAKLQDVEVLPPEAVAWVAGVEGTAAQMARTMGALAEDIRRGVAVLALRPGEEAAVEALRKQAALADARRDGGKELLAATRLLQEKDLRRLAAAEHLVDPERVVVVRCMAEVLDSDLADGIVPTPGEVAAAAVLDSTVVGMHERMVCLAGRFRRGAAAFEARPGEEALVGALERQAAKADAVHATVEAFMDTVRRYQDAGSSQPAKAGAADVIDPSSISLTPYFAHHQLAIWLLC
ncbi:hypothetical protein C2845_PM02G19090 [Panicum miliaceum]|uniref:Uncharacterized protein n=1 Tax=Panicum miliaceum TaxID=4540 RepID=A0A3L6S7K4_PANMI|nr:hypothetical protein C2845_PM02G19090 [Panicum miliaceum]